MRARSVVAIALLLVPVALSAQRIPMRVGGRRPRPELPPQPGSVAREMAYKRLRVAFESYPMVSRIEAPGSTAPAFDSWTSFGMGTRASYRLSRYSAATLDMTSTIYGGPSLTQTAELGMRFGPQRSEARWYPFLDVRGGWVSSFDSFYTPVDQLSGISVSSTRYSQGFGTVGGGGLEMAITRRFSLTTAASVMRSTVHAMAFRNSQPGPDHYTMTAYRYSIGLRYNPVRYMKTPGGI